MRYSPSQGSADSVPVSSLLSPAIPCVFATLRFCRSFVFILLRIAFLATPLFLYSSALPGGVLQRSQHPDLQAFGTANSFAYRHLPPLSPFFALFSALPSFVFNGLQPLLRKHPGWGRVARSHRSSQQDECRPHRTASTLLAPAQTSTQRAACPAEALRNSGTAAVHSLRRSPQRGSKAHPGG